jgi:hypothetical protein
MVTRLFLNVEIVEAYSSVIINISMHIVTNKSRK